MSDMRVCVSVLCVCVGGWVRARVRSLHRRLRLPLLRRRQSWQTDEEIMTRNDGGDDYNTNKRHHDQHGHMIRPGTVWRGETVSHSSDIRDPAMTSRPSRHPPLKRHRLQRLSVVITQLRTSVPTTSCTFILFSHKRTIMYTIILLLFKSLIMIIITGNHLLLFIASAVTYILL